MYKGICLIGDVPVKYHHVFARVSTLAIYE